MHLKNLILSCSASFKVYNKKTVLPGTWIHALFNHGEILSQFDLFQGIKSG